jgi:hypothetical protein
MFLEKGGCQENLELYGVESAAEIDAVACPGAKKRWGGSCGKYKHKDASLKNRRLNNAKNIAVV